MKILITGASGFVGRNLSLQLLNGENEIYSIIRSSTNRSFFEMNGLKYHIDDGSTDELIDFFMAQQFDGVIHLASCFIAEHKPNEIANLIDSNLSFSTRILEAAVRSKVKWFLNVGTFWQHYQNQGYSPVNLYAASKQAFEIIAQYYMEISDIVFSTIKLSDNYGYGDTRQKLFNLWLRIAESGECLEMSQGEQKIDIVHVKDVVSAFITMINLLNADDRYKYNGKSYAVSSAMQIKLKDLAKKFEETTCKKLNIEWGAKSYRIREVMEPWCPNEYVPGWQPTIKLKDGILDLLRNAE